MCSKCLQPLMRKFILGVRSENTKTKHSNLKQKSKSCPHGKKSLLTTAKEPHTL